MQLEFIKDYTILLASQGTRIYHKGQIIKCVNEEKAKKLIERGFAIEIKEVE